MSIRFPQIGQPPHDILISCAEPDLRFVNGDHGLIYIADIRRLFLKTDVVTEEQAATKNFQGYLLETCPTAKLTVVLLSQHFLALWSRPEIEDIYLASFVEGDLKNLLFVSIDGSPVPVKQSFLHDREWDALELGKPNEVPGTRHQALPALDDHGQAVGQRVAEPARKGQRDERDTTTGCKVRLADVVDLGCSYGSDLGCTGQTRPW